MVVLTLNAYIYIFNIGTSLSFMCGTDRMVWIRSFRSCGMEAMHNSISGRDAVDDEDPANGSWFGMMKLSDHIIYGS